MHLTFAADGRWLDGRIHATRQVPPGYAEPDPERRAIDAVRRLSAEDFGPTALKVAPDGTLTPPP